MAASLFIEEESGTWSGRIHPHNGYYAGNFSSQQREGQPTGGITTRVTTRVTT